jgi:hypothetical protein
MAKKLASYIREQINKGYDINAIRSHLMKYGYSPDKIDEAVAELYKPAEVKHTIHLSPATMITLVSVFLGLVVLSAVFFFMVREGTPAQLMDVELEGITTTAKQGGTISFITKLTSVGAKKRYDVHLRHEVISQATKKILTFKEKTKAIETSATLHTSIKIPLDATPGDYILRTIATYNGEKAIATLPIKIEKSSGTITTPEEPPKQPPEISEETCSDGIKNQDEEGIDCGGVCEPCEEPEPDVGEIDVDKLSSFEALEKVRVLAKENPSKAVAYCPKFEFQTSRDLCYEYVGEGSLDKRYCEKIHDERTKDICYANIAIGLFDAELCEQIKAEKRRNTCYMNFVRGDKKDFSVCDKVTNQYLRQACNSLKQLSKLDAEQLSYYESLINQSLVSLSLE